jgi:hypothetical protein
MADLIMNFKHHLFAEVYPFHGFVKNLDAKFFTIAPDKD